MKTNFTEMAKKIDSKIRIARDNMKLGVMGAMTGGLAVVAGGSMAHNPEVAISGLALSYVAPAVAAAIGHKKVKNIESMRESLGDGMSPDTKQNNNDFKTTKPSFSM